MFNQKDLHLSRYEGSPGMRVCRLEKGPGMKGPQVPRGPERAPKSKRGQNCKIALKIYPVDEANLKKDLHLPRTPRSLGPELWAILILMGNHILQNAQVTSNKMIHKKGRNFLAQFSFPFHMVCSILLQVLASKTIKWKLLIGCQRFSTSQKVFFLLTLAKNRSHHVKGY